MKHYIVIGISLCRCFIYTNEVKLRQVENPSDTITLRFDKFPAKKLDTLIIGHIYATGGVAYYKDTTLNYISNR